jgi:hypothetical protein
MSWKYKHYFLVTTLQCSGNSTRKRTSTVSLQFSRLDHWLEIRKFNFLVISWRILIYYPQLCISAKLGRSRKDQPSPQGWNLHRLVGGGEKILFIIIVSVLECSKGGGLLPISSMGEVWMFSVITHCKLLFRCIV